MIEYMHPITQAAFEDELEKLAARVATKNRRSIIENMINMPPPPNNPMVRTSRGGGGGRRSGRRVMTATGGAGGGGGGGGGGRTRMAEPERRITGRSFRQITGPSGAGRPSTYGRRSGQGGAPGDAPSNWRRNAAIAGGVASGVGAAELFRRKKKNRN